LKKAIRTVEAQIRRVEGFDVRLLAREGSPKRVDDYPYVRASRGTMTAAQWRKQRFTPSYGDFGVEVLKADATAAPGKTFLSTIRETYLEAGSRSQKHR
jgi:hypothetical protein